MAWSLAHYLVDQSTNVKPGFIVAIVYENVWGGYFPKLSCHRMLFHATPPVIAGHVGYLILTWDPLVLRTASQ